MIPVWLNATLAVVAGLAMCRFLDLWHHYHKWPGLPGHEKAPGYRRAFFVSAAIFVALAIHLITRSDTPWP